MGNKESVLTPARVETQVTYKGTPIRITTDSSRGTSKTQSSSNLEQCVPNPIRPCQPAHINMPSKTFIL